MLGVNGSIARAEIETPLCEECAGAVLSRETLMITASTNPNTRTPPISFLLQSICLVASFATG
jgi:hypothetical protein